MNKKEADAMRHKIAIHELRIATDNGLRYHDYAFQHGHASACRTMMRMIMATIREFEEEYEDTP